jgi:DNA polymerase-3 subunit alpha
MKKTSFVHLHLHTTHSSLNGVCRAEQVAARASSLGMGAVAITDHGTLAGVKSFAEALAPQNIMPIAGYEAYITPDERKCPPLSPSSFLHLVLLAEGEEGWRNLRAIDADARSRRNAPVPLVDRRFLAAHTKGLFALSACLEGEIPTSILRGDMDGAFILAEEYLDAFGAGNFYLEIMDHGMPEQKRVMEGLLEIHRETGISLVATNDVHFLVPEDHATHRALVGLQKGLTAEELDASGWRDPGAERYFKTGEEMAGLFADCPEAIDNAARIAARCRFLLTWA